MMHDVICARLRGLTLVSLLLACGVAMAAGPAADQLPAVSSEITVVTVASGRNPALAIVADAPALALVNASLTELAFVRAADPTGSVWATPVTVATPMASFGEHTSLAVIDGNPAIAYTDCPDALVGGCDLRYVRASDATGTTWGPSVLVHSGDEEAQDAGKYNCLAVVDGYPAISYTEPPYGTYLEFKRGNDATGSSWGPGTVAGLIPTVYTSLAVVAGAPAIAYRNYEEGALFFIRATDATGSSWHAPIQVCPGGEHASLAVVAGNPAIAHISSGALQLVRATDAAGTGWSAPVVVVGSSASHSSLAVVDGRPAMAYRDELLQRLMFVHAADATGATWSTPMIVDASGNVGEGTRLVEVERQPAIAYTDLDGPTVKFALIRSGVQVISSPFTGDDEDWLVAEMPGPPYDLLEDSFAPGYSATGGNPGGAISSTDRNASLWFFAAPAAFLGDMSPAFGSTLTFDLLFVAEGMEPGLEHPDVVLWGDGLILAVDAFPQPLQDGAWHSFSVALSDTSPWRLDNLAGDLASDQQIQTVLGDLQGLFIRGDFFGGFDQAYLDNPTLAAAIFCDGFEVGDTTRWSATTY